MLRQKDPKMHQAEISASAKKAWSDLSGDERDRLNTEAAVEMAKFKALHPNHFKDRAKSKRKAASNNNNNNNQSQSKKKKTAHSLQSQQDQQQITYQVPINAMEMVQQPQSFIRNEQSIQIQNDMADQIQYEQLSEVDSSQGTRTQDRSIPGGQVQQTTQTPRTESSFSLDGASNFHEAQINENGTPKSQEQQAAPSPVGEPLVHQDEGLVDFHFDDFIDFDNYQLEEQGLFTI
ncbi:hypothetical protein GQX73_g8314 [Xylaria multiplex]|uniref:Uncharacterized protein n=1 Tax=Xylaria multiplex TaxID=323545 RepID=A0A7C8MN14_9PEZI|nr:hypothetical protein GQX73_g8314 [Xylaria multiplex]